MKIKHGILVLSAVLLFFGGRVFGADIDKLIAQRQYFTAFKELRVNYNETQDTEVLARLVRFIPRYYADSQQGFIFLFKDLEAGETVEGLRRYLPAGEYEGVLFNVLDVYEKHVAARGSSAALDLALGEYIDDAIRWFGDNWVLTVDEANTRIDRLFRSAFEGGQFTAASLSRLGDIEYREMNLQGAKEMYLKSLEQDGEYAHSHNNLAVVLMRLEEMDNFFYHIDEAIRLYPHSLYQADAYITAAQGAVQIREDEKSRDYFLAGHREYPEDYRFPQNLNNYYLFKKQFEEAAKYADILFAQNTTNPNSCRIVIDTYAYYKYFDELEKFFQRNIKKYKGQDETLGNLYFHLALVYDSQKRSSDALKAVKQAEKQFRKCLPEDHGVFSTIDEIKANIIQGMP